jgi:hypothetical protein
VLRVVWSVYCIAYCALRVAGCGLRVACCVLRVAGCVLRVACCSACEVITYAECGGVLCCAL